MRFKILDINDTKYSIREAFVDISLIVGLFIVISTELLSLFNFINKYSLIAIWIIFILYLYFKILSNLKNYKISIRNCLNFFFKKKNYLTIFVFFIIFFTFITAILYPPNTPDSMTYHMVKVENWIQNKNVNFYPTVDTRQLILPPFSEYSILHLQIIFNNDYFANLVQWFAMLGSLAGVCFITKELGGNRKAQTFSIFFCATLPMGILQSSSTQTDYVVSFWLIIMIFCLIKLFKTKKINYILKFSIALGLAILTKPTAYLFAFAFCLWLTWEFILKKKKRNLFYLLYVPVFIFLLNMSHYNRNFELYGNPLGTHYENVQATNQIFSAPQTLSNVIRNLSLNLSIPSKSFNSKTREKIVQLHYFLGIEADDKRTTQGGEYFIPFSFYESTAPNYIHFIIILIILFALIVKRLKINRMSTIYFICLIIGFILFSFILKWQPYGSRLMLPLFVLSSPIVSLVLSKINLEKILPLIILIISINAMPYILMNKSRPLLGTISLSKTGSLYKLDYPDWSKKNREELYFVRKPEYYNIYKNVALIARKKKCEVIDLELSTITWQYPLMIFIKKELSNSNIIFRQVNVKNLSKYKKQKIRNFNKKFLCKIVENKKEKKYEVN